MVDIKDIFQTNFGDSCLDGYTLDFLESNPNPIYKNLPSIKGYRELYVTNSEYFTPTTDNNFEENESKKIRPKILNNYYCVDLGYKK